MLCTYQQEDIKRMSILAHTQLQKELDRSLGLTTHVNELCSRSSSTDSKFQGANSLYKLPYPRTIKVAPPPSEMFAALQTIMGELTDLGKKYEDDAEELYNKRKELIRATIKPKYVIQLDEPVPNGMWWGDTLKGVNLRPGLLNNDKSKPYPGFIGGNKVHALIGGDTGQGKSVLVKAMVIPMLYEYPPWELCLWMNDMKMLEFGVYAQTYKCQQIKVVAATQSPAYILSAMEQFEREMNMLYAIAPYAGSQSLAGIRDFLDMYIPRNVMLTDEFSQLYALGSNREIQRADFLIQSVAKLGRAVGYHFAKASQDFAGTIPATVINQFSVGIGVGCGESTSESLIGNKGATSLLTKVGYCIINQNRKTGEDIYNDEYKVAFLDDKSDTDKLEFQMLLKKVYDTGLSLECPQQMEFYNESTQKDLKFLEEDVMFACEKSMASNKYPENLLMPVTLGSFMKYTGIQDDVAYFNWECVRRNNIFLNSTSIDKLKYLCYRLADNIGYHLPNSLNIAVIDNSEMFEEFGLNFRKNLTGEFDVQGILNACTFRTHVLKYNLSCKGFGTIPNILGFLEYLFKKEKNNVMLDLIGYMNSDSSVNSLTAEELLKHIGNRIDGKTIEQTEKDTLENKIISTGKAMHLLEVINTYILTTNVRKGDYLKSQDFNPTIYWFFEPLLNEGLIHYGSVKEQFIQLLAMGPTVGVFFILVTTDCRGMKTTMMNTRHLITCNPQSAVENMGFGDYLDKSGIGYKYSFIEGEGDSDFYFKEYFYTKS